MLTLVFLTGCSAQEIQNTIGLNDTALKQDLTFNWFGRSDAESRDGSSPYSNSRDYIIQNFDITEVSESSLASLPGYDFSGPSSSGKVAGTTDESLLSSSDGGSSEETQEKKQVVYLVPLYSGFSWDAKSDPLRVRSIALYKDYISKSSSTDYEDFCSSYYTKLYRNKNRAAFSADGFGQSTFAGLKYTYTGPKFNGNATCYQWQVAWNLCRATGRKLKKDGYTVVYPDSKNKDAAFSDDAETFFENKSKLKDFNKIAADAVEQQADCVVFIGFNDKGFEPVIGNDVTCKTTYFAYHSYTMGESSVGNKGFTEALQRNFGKTKNLKGSGLDTIGKPVDAFGGAWGSSANQASVYGMQKAQTALMSLRIQKYDGKSAAVLFGNFGSNVRDTDKITYSYEKPASLGKALAVAIEKAL